MTEEVKLELGPIQMFLLCTCINEPEYNRHFSDSNIQLGFTNRGIRLIPGPKMVAAECKELMEKTKKYVINRTNKLDYSFIGARYRKSTHDKLPEFKQLQKSYQFLLYSEETFQDELHRFVKKGCYHAMKYHFKGKMETFKKDSDLLSVLVTLKNQSRELKLKLYQILERPTDQPKPQPVIASQSKYVEKNPPSDIFQERKDFTQPIYGEKEKKNTDSKPNAFQSEDSQQGSRKERKNRNQNNNQKSARFKQKQKEQTYVPKDSQKSNYVQKQKAKPQLEAFKKKQPTHTSKPNVKYTELCLDLTNDQLLVGYTEGSFDDYNLPAETTLFDSFDKLYIRGPPEACQNFKSKVRKQLKQWKLVALDLNLFKNFETLKDRVAHIDLSVLYPNDARGVCSQIIKKYYIDEPKVILDDLEQKTSIILLKFKKQQQTKLLEIIKGFEKNNNQQAENSDQDCSDYCSADEDDSKNNESKGKQVREAPVSKFDREDFLTYLKDSGYKTKQVNIDQKQGKIRVIWYNSKLSKPIKQYFRWTCRVFILDQEADMVKQSFIECVDDAIETSFRTGFCPFHQRDLDVASKDKILQRIAAGNCSKSQENKYAFNLVIAKGLKNLVRTFEEELFTFRKNIRKACQITGLVEDDEAPTTQTSTPATTATSSATVSNPSASPAAPPTPVIVYLTEKLPVTIPQLINLHLPQPTIGTFVSRIIERFLAPLRQLGEVIQITRHNFRIKYQNSKHPRVVYYQKLLRDCVENCIQLKQLNEFDSLEQLRSEPKIEELKLPLMLCKDKVVLLQDKDQPIGNKKRLQQTILIIGRRVIETSPIKACAFFSIRHRLQQDSQYTIQLQHKFVGDDEVQVIIRGYLNQIYWVHRKLLQEMHLLRFESQSLTLYASELKRILINNQAKQMRLKFLQKLNVDFHIKEVTTGRSNGKTVTVVKNGSIINFIEYNPALNAASPYVKRLVVEYKQVIYSQVSPNQIQMGSQSLFDLLCVECTAEDQRIEIMTRASKLKNDILDAFRFLSAVNSPKVLTFFISSEFSYIVNQTINGIVNTGDLIGLAGILSQTKAQAIPIYILEPYIVSSLEQQYLLKFTTTRTDQHNLPQARLQALAGLVEPLKRNGRSLYVSSRRLTSLSTAELQNWLRDASWLPQQVAIYLHRLMPQSPEFLSLQSMHKNLKRAYKVQNYYSWRKRKADGVKLETLYLEIQGSSKMCELREWTKCTDFKKEVKSGQKIVGLFKGIVLNESSGFSQFFGLGKVECSYVEPAYILEF